MISLRFNGAFTIPFYLRLAVMFDTGLYSVSNYKAVIVTHKESYHDLSSEQHVPTVV